MSTLIAPSGNTAVRPRSTSPNGTLPVYRLNLMRVGYLVVAVGLVVFKWPLLFGTIATLPLYEGVETALLTAVSLFAFIGLKHPVAMLPIMLFETIWKVIWVATVVIPQLIAGGIDDATTTVLINCSVVLIVIAVTPWRFAWRRYALTKGDKWRR